MTRKWEGTTEERYQRLDKTNRRCDGNNRRCTHGAVERYELQRLVDDSPAEIVTKQSCSRHRQQFVNNERYVVRVVERIQERPAVTQRIESGNAQ